MYSVKYFTDINYKDMYINVTSVHTLSDLAEFLSSMRKWAHVGP